MPEAAGCKCGFLYSETVVKTSAHSEIQEQKRKNKSSLPSIQSKSENNDKHLNHENRTREPDDRNTTRELRRRKKNRKIGIWLFLGKSLCKYVLRTCKDMRMENRSVRVLHGVDSSKELNFHFYKLSAS